MLRRLPIQKRLMSIMLLTSSAVLVLTCAGFLIHEIITFRAAMVRQLSTLAGVVANNSTAALAFQDREGAQEILSALKADPHVARAALYDGDGKVFSTYSQGGGTDGSGIPASPEADGFRFIPSYLVGFQPVNQGNNRLGTLYVKSDMQVIADRFKLYGLVAALVAAVATLLAVILSRALQKQISLPILTLAETARRVSKHRDYSVRARKTDGGEVEELTDAFNHMLTQIQEQLARVDLLNRITRAIGERLDLASIFQVMTGTVEQDLPLDFACVCQYTNDGDAGGGRLTVASIGPRGADAAAAMGLTPGTAIPIDKNGLSRCVQGELVYEPDIAGVDFPFPKRLASQGLRSLVMAPLVVESSVFGVLVAARREPDSFTSMDCESVRQLSAHAALASHQANLYGELQKAYDELRQSQQTVLQQERLRALGQMASGIAHDINNAISPVSLYTEFLLDKEPGLSPRAREQLQTISHAIEDVAATVSRMKEFYRQREAEMNLSPVQLNRCVQQVIDLTKARWGDMAQQRGFTIAVKTELASDLPLVMSVEGEVREALTNLYLNAFDAMPEGGTMTVRTRAHGNHVLVEVTDTGTGMDEETRRRCLDPFFTTKGERGSGLGLAMVYGMAQRHSATVEIDSTLGKGTTFRILFDLPTGVVADGSPAAPSGPGRRLHLLVVDDDPLLLKSLHETLSEDGHKVTAASGGQAGVETFRAAVKDGRTFDAVITDLGMPYVDGRKVAASVKEASASTPVILLTGWGQRLLTEGDIPPHVDRVLSKPPKLAQLREAFASLAKPMAAPAGPVKEGST